MMLNQIQLKESVRNRENMISIKNQIVESMKEEKKQFLVKRENLVKEIQKNKRLIDNLKLQLPVILDKLNFEEQDMF